MKLAVIGSRGFTNYGLMCMLLDKLDIDEIVSGGAGGADKLAERYAQEHDIKLNVIPANWDKFGKSAGYIRNSDIWNASTSGIAFWDSKSKGTKHSFDIVKKQKKNLLVVEYNANKVYVLKYKE